MSRIPIAVQVYSVRKEAEADLPGVLAAIAKMGYEGVEFAGYYGHSAEEIRKMLEDNGLQCCGTHVGIDTLLDDEFEKSVDFHQALGNTRPIVPGLPPQYTESPEAWLKTADIFNEIADKLAAYGMQTGYHNHHTEFTPFPNGELPWDIFFGNTKDSVIMQFDTGNAMLGGREAIPFLKKYPGRARTVHLKPFSPSLVTPDNPHAGFRPAIGEDETPWQELLQTCETIGGTEWYIVEYESDKYPPLEAIEICLKALKEMGK
ncbi:MAG: sugar phosphate isomerase/epimerase family protein [Candidatus Zipacnadales bacterium]